MRISDWSSDVCSSDLPVEHVILHRRADADLDHPACIDQALADGVVEAGPMAVSQAEAVWPGIHMGVEMHEADRPALPFRPRAQQRQGDGLVATQCDEVAEAGRSEEHPAELQSLMRIS